MWFLRPARTRVFVDRAMDRDQAAEPGQAPAERQLPQRSARLCALRRDEDDERVAFTAVGETGREQADRLQRDDAGETELHHAGVLMLAFVVEQEAAALDALRIDREADAFRRNEAQIEIREMQIRLGTVVGEIQTELHPDAIDRRDHGPDLRAERERGLNQRLRLGARRVAVEIEQHLQQTHRADALADRNLQRNAAALQAGRYDRHIGKVVAGLRAAAAAGGVARERERFRRGLRSIAAAGPDERQVAGGEESVARRCAYTETELDARLLRRQHRADEIVERRAVEREPAIVESKLRSRIVGIERAG